MHEKWILKYSLNQCLFIANWTLRNKLQWFFSQKSKLFIHKNASENIVCKMAVIYPGRDELIICVVNSYANLTHWRVAGSMRLVTVASGKDIRRVMNDWRRITLRRRYIHKHEVEIETWDIKQRKGLAPNYYVSQEIHVALPSYGNGHGIFLKTQHH